MTREIHNIKKEQNQKRDCSWLQTKQQQKSDDSFGIPLWILFHPLCTFTLGVFRIFGKYFIFTHFTCLLQIQLNKQQDLRLLKGHYFSFMTQNLTAGQFLLVVWTWVRQCWLYWHLIGQKDQIKIILYNSKTWVPEQKIFPVNVNVIQIDKLIWNYCWFFFK